MPIIVDPPSEDRIEHPRDVLQRLIRFKMNSPVPDNLPHGLTGLIADPRGKIDEVLSMAILRPSRTECISQKVKFCLWELSAPVFILTIDNARFVRMQFQTTLIKTFI